MGGSRKTKYARVDCLVFRSSHQGMQDKICLKGNLLEETDVDSYLRQGCCMPPVIFNLHTCLMMECWQARVERVPGVGINIKYKYDEKLFRRYTRNAMERKLTECLFADDGAILASTRSGAERAVAEFQSVSMNFGLTVSIPKTKHMATRREAVD